MLSIDPNVLIVANELASVVHTHPNRDIAGQCAAIIREYHEDRLSEEGERAIVCTALVESGHEGTNPGVPTAVRVFGLDTEEKRMKWLDE